MKDSVVEGISITLAPNFIITCVYVPPNCSDSYHLGLNDFIKNLTSTSSSSVSLNHLIIGDFNSPDINWSTLCAPSSQSDSLCNTIFSCNLFQLVNSPTHVKGNILDLVLANCPDLISNVVVHSYNPSLHSDHCIISLFVGCHKSVYTIPSHSFFNYARADWSGLNDYLLNLDFSFCQTSSNVDLIWSEIRSIIMTGSSLFIPKLSQKRSHLPKWFTPPLRHSLNKVCSLRRLVIRRCYPSHLVAKLEFLEGCLQQQIKDAKAAYELKLFTNFAEDKSSLYKHLRLISNSRTIPNLVYWGESKADQILQKCELFNRFFNSVFIQNQSSVPNLHMMPVPNAQMDHIAISEADVWSILCSLDPHKAEGPDKISPRLLKECATPLTPPLTVLFNQCLTSASIPLEWKVHQITPVYKSGDRSSVTNYRPISLLCIASKVLERLIYNKIIDFIQPQLSKFQFGFLTNRSCLHKLLLFLSNVVQALNDKSQLDVVFLDFQKAFDTVSHQELLFKLSVLGITGQLLDWFAGYLTDRVHKVSLDSCSSNVLPVKSGVPQGSILGPLLFLVYVNDIFSATIPSSLFLFADDSQSFRSIKCSEDCSLFQNDLDSLTEWSHHWKLKFNVPKCVHMKFGSLIPDSSYSINGSPITSTTEHKDVGILITSNLSFTSHINNILSKAYKVLGMVRRAVSSSRNIALKRALYLTLIRSQVIYCCQIWRPYLIRESRVLERLQRRATKFILDDYEMGYKQRLVKIHILPLTLWMELQDILLFLTLLKNPPDNFNLLDYVSFSTTSTRSSSTNKLVPTSLCIPRLNSTRHFYFCRIVRVWNSLPPFDIQNSYKVLKNFFSTLYWNYFVNNYNPDVPCTWYRVCPCCKCASIPVAKF